MKFFDRLNLRRFAKLAAVAAVGGTLFFGGTAPVDAATDGMAAFREAYFAQNPDLRIFEQDFTLIAPTFHLEIDSKAQVSRDGTFLMGGELMWTYTNLKRNYSTNTSIPFFLSQYDENELTLYVKRLNKWSKMTLPGLPAGIALMWKSNDMSTLRETMSVVKNVELLNDTAEQRIMNITLNGAEVAKNLTKRSESSLKDANAEQKASFDRWVHAIGANDITFTWTVKKPEWETVSAVFDLTNIMRAYARYVLDESAAGRIVLTDEERDLLDAMGYYAELKSYTTHIPTREAFMIHLPENFSSVPENDNALDDILYEMTSVVEK